MKTKKLTGAALDWAVAKCEGWDLNTPTKIKDFLISRTCHYKYNYSTRWESGGPTIEREGITVKCQGLHWLKTPKSNPESAWVATLDLYSGGEYGTWLEPSNYTGPTTLIAAMRCYVASKLGEEVEIPEELKE